MSANQVLLFIIVGQNEPLYEAEIQKRGAVGNSDAVARQNYFVVHSALDLVEKSAWTTQNVCEGQDVKGFMFFLSTFRRQNLDPIRLTSSFSNSEPMPDVPKSC
jgi:hypothetical protein